MAGAGYKLYATGDILTAAQVNNYLQEQTVMVFASAAARTSALSLVLAEGMVSYLADTNVVEVYNGSAWASLDDPNAIQNTIVDAKGDVITATAADTPARLAVGANDTVLTADSTAATGLKWAAVPSSSATYTSYTPTFTNFTLGNGTINVARYIQNGKQVSGYMKVTLGSTSSMGTNPIFTLPVTASSNMQASATIGSANIDDAGAAAYEGIVKYSTTTTARLTVANASATYVQTSVILSTVPMTWVSTDSFTLDFTYEAA
jgi:hypothetical protein